MVKRSDSSVINSKFRGLLDLYQEWIDNIRNIELYTCWQVKSMITSCFSDWKETVKSAGESFIRELKSEGRDSYATSIGRVYWYFMEFAKGDIMLSDITPMIIQNFTASLRGRKVTETTVSTMLAQLKSVINRAIRMQLVTNLIHRLFHSDHICSYRKLDLSLQNFNKIRLSKPDRRKTMVAKDLFCLSFYLGGINLIDLMNIDFRKPYLSIPRRRQAEE